MKKRFIVLIILFATPFMAFATQLNISTDKTSVTMDDVVRVSITVNGQVDGGQIGVKGLENFTIVGRQSSQNIEVINGQTSVAQTKELALRPNKSGTFTLTALAKENGNDINSNNIEINVEKSSTEKVKDELLNNTQNSNNVDKKQSQTDNSNLDKIVQEQEPVSDFDDLLKPEEIREQQNGSEDDLSKLDQGLELKEVKNFPAVRHISAFNLYFWVEFLLILVVIVALIGTVSNHPVFANFPKFRLRLVSSSPKIRRI